MNYKYSQTPYTLYEKMLNKTRQKRPGNKEIALKRTENQWKQNKIPNSIVKFIKIL
jgi:hypothetical protein